MEKVEQKRTGYTTNLARAISKVVKPVMRKRGFYDVDIIADWSFIVGQQWADLSIPKKLSFNPKLKRSGTLHIQVSPGASVLMQHIEPQIIDRVNTYFGFEAVKKLRLIHGVIPKATERQSKSASRPVVPLPTIDKVENENLKLALQRFGQAMSERNQMKEQK